MPFLNASLDFVYQDLKQRKPFHSFNIVKQSSICKSRGKFNAKKYDTLIKGKGLMPYSAMKSVDYLKKTKKPPPKSHYFNDLKFEPIDDQTYTDIKSFWKIFGCKSLLDYCTYYVSICITITYMDSS